MSNKETKETKEIKEENLEDVSGGAIGRTGSNYKVYHEATGNKVYEGKNIDDANKADIKYNS